MTTKQQKTWLRAKGYDLTGKSPEHVANLFALYHPKRPPHPRPAEWKQWQSTNRPHHVRTLPT